MFSRLNETLTTQAVTDTIARPFFLNITTVIYIIFSTVVSPLSNESIEDESQTDIQKT